MHFGSPSPTPATTDVPTPIVHDLPATEECVAVALQPVAVTVCAITTPDEPFGAADRPT